MNVNCATQAHGYFKYNDNPFETPDGQKGIKNIQYQLCHKILTFKIFVEISMIIETFLNVG